VPIYSTLSRRLLSVALISREVGGFGALIILWFCSVNGASRYFIRRTAVGLITLLSPGTNHDRRRLMSIRPVVVDARCRMYMYQCRLCLLLLLLLAIWWWTLVVQLLLYWPISPVRQVSAARCISAVHFRQLQNVLISAARIILRKQRLDHVADYIRIEYKMCVLVYKCLHQSAPISLSELCIPVVATATRSHLRSAVIGNLVISNCRTKRYEQRSFAFTGRLFGTHSHWQFVTRRYHWLRSACY